MGRFEDLTPLRKTFHRTPSQIRRLARQKTIQPENEYLLYLRFRPPYHWQGMLAFLAARATPGVELVTAGSYSRSICVDGKVGHFEVTLDEEHDSLRVRIQFGDPRFLFFIVERIRTMFDLNADWIDIGRILQADPALAPLVESAPGLRVPGCWNGFELATRAILGQQISVRGATTLAGRIVKQFGQVISGAGGLTHLFPSPEFLAGADLSGIGLTKARSETIRGLARAVCGGRIRFEGIVELESFLERFREIPGIGKWTAQYVAMRALGEPDALPVGDVALMSALDLTNPRELEWRAEPWRPWRAYATMYLWSSGSHRQVSTRKRISPSARKEMIHSLGLQAAGFNT